MASLQKLLEQLVTCPTCEKKLIQNRSTDELVMRCPDLFHGKFTIAKVDGAYTIAYTLKRQQLV
jgi:hypothetical protein